MYTFFPRTITFCDSMCTLFFSISIMPTIPDPSWHPVIDHIRRLPVPSVYLLSLKVCVLYSWDDVVMILRMLQVRLCRLRCLAGIAWHLRQVLGQNLCPMLIT